MSPALVSCIIPTFNSEPFLGDCLRSVSAQTYRPLDIIIVDDGSTDGSARVMASLDIPVTWIQQQNRGEAAARNAGVRAAQGPFLAFLDADDLWEPEKIARQMVRLQEAPEIDLCFTWFQNFWMPELADEERRYQGHAVTQPSASWSICTLLTRRGVFERFGPFDENLRCLPNMTWFLRAAGLRANIAVLPEVLMRRRLHRGNTTRLNDGFNYDEFLPMLKAWRDYQRSSA